ncbi:T-cell-specific surface glycoprotein CD28-like [Erpetoichthys calabaricus]|uniref:T-cell-specific surface glycoprotein CD28-like n=1 Tax=Erpetoichthys calabaricus TaxID=27687 RepID=UPI0022348995|nr:T-cell-specific surface glycoprotein CD28-like [Erpetoichthys calabaricus]
MSCPPLTTIVLLMAHGRPMRTPSALASTPAIKPVPRRPQHFLSHGACDKGDAGAVPVTGSGAAQRETAREPLAAAMILPALLVMAAICCTEASQFSRMVVPVGSGTLVPCSFQNPTTKEVKVQLVRGEKEDICSVLLPEKKVNITEPRVCRIEAFNHSVTFHLSSLQQNDSDLYSCDMLTLYPPPFLKITLNKTMVCVIDKAEEKNCPQCPDVMSGGPLQLALWILLAFLTLYSLIMSIALFVSYVKLTRSKQMQNDYMNMPSKQKKKQRVVHPNCYHTRR